jgi:hypothetical protein
MTATATNAVPADPDVEDDQEEFDGVLAPGLEQVGKPQIVSLRSAENPPEDERVPAYRVNGVTYSILTKPKTNQSLEYLHLARTRGTEIALDYAMECLLGVEGYQALREFDELTEEDLKAVCDAANRIMAGPVEAPKGKPKNGSRRSRG